MREMCGKDVSVISTVIAVDGIFNVDGLVDINAKCQHFIC